MWNSDAFEPLRPCCKAFTRERLFALVRPTAKAAEFLLMALLELMRQRAPLRMHELRRCTFGVFVNDDPFWGIYDYIQCPACGRDLHVLAIDGRMMMIIDELVQRLHPLLDPNDPDELMFRAATAQEQEDARKSLAQMVFLQPTELVERIPKPGTKPHICLAEAMCSAYVFMVAHETSHQGLQAALPDHYKLLIPTALACAAQMKITLSPSQVKAWARELHADQNALLIMIGSLRFFKPEVTVIDGRALIAGVALALGAWDLILREYCYGNTALMANLVRTHPPANSRIEALHKSIAIFEKLKAFSGDVLWAERVLAALSDLHG